jgi:hypothetical protein
VSGGDISTAKIPAGNTNYLIGYNNTPSFISSIAIPPLFEVDLEINGFDKSTGNVTPPYEAEILYGGGAELIPKLYIYGTNSPVGFNTTTIDNIDTYYVPMMENGNPVDCEIPFEWTKYYDLDEYEFIWTYGGKVNVNSFSSNSYEAAFIDDDFSDYADYMANLTNPFTITPWKDSILQIQNLPIGEYEFKLTATMITDSPYYTASSNPVYLRIKGGKLIIRSVWAPDTALNSGDPYQEAPNNMIDGQLQFVDVTVTKYDTDKKFHVASKINDADIGADFSDNDRVYVGVDDVELYTIEDNFTAYVPYGYTATIADPIEATGYGSYNGDDYTDDDRIIIITVTTKKLPFYRDCASAPLQ